MNEVTRLFDAPYYQMAKYPKKDCLAYKYDGKWREYSTQEVIDIVNAMSAGFLKMGFQKDDKIALISSNRPEWNFVDLGMLQIGAINVPVYPTISPEEYQFIFNDAQIKMVIVENEDLLNKIEAVRDGIPSLEHIYSIEQIERVPNWNEIYNLGVSEGDQSAVETAKAAVSPDDLASLIYTSGTTGMPKGVMLTHNNIVSNIKSVFDLLPLDNNKRALSFLPLCHIFERTVSYTYLLKGTSIWYAESIEKLGDNLREVKPHYFSTVPRLLEKVYEKIMAKGAEQTGIKKTLFDWAVDLGSKYDIQKRGAFYDFKLGIAQKLIFSKWLEAMGGEVEGIITGAAKLPEYLARTFNACGIFVREGYGMTEASPVITFNRFDMEGARISTVGLPIPGVEVKLAEDGEVLAKGPNVMKGYYNNPEATADTIKDGWLHTGDIGEWENIGGKKFLKITDRKKALFKTSGGKYVAPQTIEEKYKKSPYIDQLMVVGSDRKYVAALIVPAFEKLEDHCKQQGMNFISRDEMVRDERVRAIYEGIQKEVNPSISHVEQVKRFVLVPTEWTIDGKELTATMKLRRKVVDEKYAGYIDELYS